MTRGLDARQIDLNKVATEYFIQSKPQHVRCTCTRSMRDDVRRRR
jgi:hypothetical protein